MVKDPVSARYAAALFELARERGALDQAAADMQALGEVIAGEPKLRQFLVNPDVEVEDKVGVLERLLQGSWSPDTRAFVQVVLGFGRAEFLGEMAGAFAELIDRERGIVRAQVRTARPLAEPLRSALRQRLEARERRTVELSEEIVPELIGGIQVILENRLFDGSIRTELADLRHRLKSVRVH